MVLCKRIIPCLDIDKGRVVKGTKFINLQDAGDPVEFGKYYEEEGADELVFLDITATVEKRKTVVELVKKVADGVSIPFAVGGGIASMEDVKAILDAGADKVSLNSAAVRNPNILAEISKEYGSERIVCAIDGDRVYVDSEKEAKDKNLVKVGDKYCWFNVMTHSGRKSTGMDAIEWSKKVKVGGRL